MEFLFNFSALIQLVAAITSHIYYVSLTKDLIVLSAIQAVIFKIPLRRFLQKLSWIR